MANVENPEEEAAAAAEPSECSRRMLACTVGLIVVLLLVSSHTTELQESHPESRAAAAGAVAVLALLLWLCFGLVFIIIVIDYIKGLSDGYQLFVDDLIQSDRFILVEAAHQFVRHMDHNQHGDA